MGTDLRLGCAQCPTPPEKHLGWFAVLLEVTQQATCEVEVAWPVQPDRHHGEPGSSAGLQQMGGEDALGDDRPVVGDVDDVRTLRLRGGQVVPRNPCSPSGGQAVQNRDGSVHIP